VEVVAWPVVDVGLAVVAVMRVGHADVMTDLVDEGRRQSVTDRTEVRRVEAEDEALGAVAPVVIGVAEEPRREIFGRVVGEDRYLVVAVSFEVLEQVGVVVDEQVGKRDPEDPVADVSSEGGMDGLPSAPAAGRSVKISTSATIVVLRLMPISSHYPVHTVMT
ncbi:MAG: hypothetical protein ACRD1H_04465, partial [Vicinamibacterales bacterium]